MGGLGLRNGSEEPIALILKYRHKCISNSNHFSLLALQRSEADGISFHQRSWLGLCRLSVCSSMQILGLVQVTIGVLSFAGVLVILIINLTRGEGAEYSVVTFFVLLVCCIPVGELLDLAQRLD